MLLCLVTEEDWLVPRMIWQNFFKILYPIRVGKNRYFPTIKIFQWISNHPRHHPVFLNNLTDQNFLKRLASDQLQQPSHNQTPVIDRHFQTKIFCCIWINVWVIQRLSQSNCRKSEGQCGKMSPKERVKGANTVLRGSVRAPIDFLGTNPRLQNRGGTAPNVLQLSICPRKIPRKPLHCPAAQCRHPRNSHYDDSFSHTAPRIFHRRYDYQNHEVLSDFIRHRTGFILQQTGCIQHQTG